MHVKGGVICALPKRPRVFSHSHSSKRLLSLAYFSKLKITSGIFPLNLTLSLHLFLHSSLTLSGLIKGFFLPAPTKNRLIESKNRRKVV